jgi:hypothetical protein
MHMQTSHGSLLSITHWIRVALKKTHPPVKKIDPLCVRVAESENIRIDLMISRRSFELSDVICRGADFL